MVLTEVYNYILDVFRHIPIQILATVAVALVVQLIIHRSIDRVVHRTVRRHHYTNKLDQEKREQTLTTIFRTALGVVLWVGVAALVLVQLRIDLTSLLTGAGLIGIIVGFGAQNVIRDFLAGIFTIAENQYRVGDIVTFQAEGTQISGEVEDITIRITRLRDLDGNLHTVRNGSIAIVSNLSFGYANVNVDIGVSYDVNIDKVETVINKVGRELAEDQQWSPHIFEPIQFLRVDGFEDSAVRVKALGKVEPAKQWDIAGEFRRRLKKTFEEHAIDIALPQLVIHQGSKK